MAQCEHEFKADAKTNEVKCIKCGDYDDEMQQNNRAKAIKEEENAFYRTQINFE